VLIVTTYENPDYLFEALKAGAAGYILKDAPKRQLLGSIRRVLDGEAPLNQELAARLIRRLAEGSEPPAQERRQQELRPRQEPAPQRPQGREAPPPLEALTPREVEVLQYLAQGQTNPDIARTLSVSRGTVKVHVQHIIAKLGVSDRTQAAIRALDLGLIRPNRNF
jgi:DNA-binding NarL/FixJ family response regulator